MPVGLAVTLRSERAYEFLDRLLSVAIPRIRDFRGLSRKSFDGRGNYTLGVREQIIFPEIDYDAIDQVRGLDVTITTSAPTDEEALALLDAVRDALHPRADGELGDHGQDVKAGRRARPNKYKTREYSRCRRCGRPRAVYRKFGICRICLRELAHNGFIPGMTKSSW